MSMMIASVNLTLTSLPTQAVTMKAIIFAGLVLIAALGANADCPPNFSCAQSSGTNPAASGGASWSYFYCDNFSGAQPQCSTIEPFICPPPYTGPFSDAACSIPLSGASPPPSTTAPPRPPKQPRASRPPPPPPSLPTPKDFPPPLAPPKAKDLPPPSIQSPPPKAKDFPPPAADQVCTTCATLTVTPSSFSPSSAGQPNPNANTCNSFADVMNEYAQVGPVSPAFLLLPFSLYPLPSLYPHLS